MKLGSAIEIEVAVAFDPKMALDCAVCGYAHLYNSNSARFCSLSLIRLAAWWFVENASKKVTMDIYHTFLRKTQRGSFYLGLDKSIHDICRDYCHGEYPELMELYEVGDFTTELGDVPQEFLSDLRKHRNGETVKFPWAYMGGDYDGD